MVKRYAFLTKAKSQYHLSRWGECVYGAQSWKERRLFCEYVFVKIDQRTLTLKMVGRFVFLMKPKPQYHLSWCGECVCGAQSLKGRRLLCKSEFIQLKNEFKSKNGKKRCFCYETKGSISSIPVRRMRLWCLIMKRKEIILWIHVCPNRPKSIASKNGGKICFSNETKASISFIPMRRICLWCPIIKRKEINM